MDGLTGFMAVGTGWVAILMPVFITWVILYYGAKMDKIGRASCRERV